MYNLSASLSWCYICLGCRSSINNVGKYPLPFTPLCAAGSWWLHFLPSGCPGPSHSFSLFPVAMLWGSALIHRGGVQTARPDSSRDWLASEFLSRPSLLSYPQTIGRAGVHTLILWHTLRSLFIQQEPESQLPHLPLCGDKMTSSSVWGQDDLFPCVGTRWPLPPCGDKMTSSPVWGQDAQQVWAFTCAHHAVFEFVFRTRKRFILILILLFLSDLVFDI